MSDQMSTFEIDRSKYDAADDHKSKFVATPGLTKDLVIEISKSKNEPKWMLEKRLKGLELFEKTKVPNWGPDLKDLDFNEIIYYVRPDAKETTTWDEVPEEIKQTFEKLGIPEAERKALAGVGAQYDSDIVYHKIEEKLKDQGVIFENMDVAVQKYPELVKKYFMSSCIPVNDHKFIMLHAAVWSGGTFIYVPKGVKVDLPLQAYFRMNAAQGGQFEHTLIIVDEGADLHYIEGCFTKGTLVTTNPGFKSIENINQGDRVLTHNGKYEEVENIAIRPYSGKIYDIEVYGDSTQKIGATTGHPFLYVDRNSKKERNKKWIPRWNTPEFFNRLDYITIPINKTIKNNKYKTFKTKKGIGRTFKTIERKVKITPNFFRLIGYYLAEGSISKGSYLNFSFGAHEKELIKDVKGLIKESFGLDKFHEFKHKKNNGINLVFSSVELCRIFKEFGTSCYTKKVPDWVFFEIPEKQKELVKGVWLGDGNYYKKRTKSGFKELFRINTTSEQLARQLREIGFRIGIPSFLNARDRKKEGRRTMYTVGISGEYMKQFGELVEIKIDKKINNKKRASMFYIDDEFVYAPIKKITEREVEDLPVYDISVKNAHTFVVGASVHNCSSPVFSKNSLHAGCVEIFVHKDAKMRYSSIENWSKNVYNLNTKRAIVEKDARMEFINGNMGSCKTMLYPCSILVGEGASTDNLGIAFAGPNQDQDTGSKVIHAAPNTTSTIVAKSISRGGGIASYRGSVQVAKNATNSKCSVVCDALLIDDKSVSNTYPFMNIESNKVDIAHEASVGKIGDEEIFYLMSRGLSEEEAIKMVVSGFATEITKKLPLEYAVELNKLIELEMEGSIG